MKKVIYIAISNVICYSSIVVHIVEMRSRRVELESNSSYITVQPSRTCTAEYENIITCVGTGDGLSWTVQGYTLSNPSNKNREISVTTNNISVGVLSSVLIIRALSINNVIIIGCIIYNGFYAEIRGAILTIKGHEVSKENMYDHSYI